MLHTFSRFSASMARDSSAAAMSCANECPNDTIIVIRVSLLVSSECEIKPVDRTVSPEQTLSESAEPDYLTFDV